MPIATPAGLRGTNRAVGQRAKLVREMRGHVAPRVEDTAERMVALAYRQSEINAGIGQGNLYQQRFANYLQRCVYTVDEARAGVVKKFPTGRGLDGRAWMPIWLDLEDVYLRKKLVFIEKSRRVLASWFTCAFDIWLAAGGQDERWVNQDGEQVLMNSTGYRQIIIATRKAEGYAGSEWFIERRIKVILDEFEQRGLRKYWPDFPEWTYKTGEIQFSNGSSIIGVPKGSDQLRGGAATWLHMEEVAFWEKARHVIGGALHTLRGGGHACLITTPQVGTYAKDIRDGKI